MKKHEVVIVGAGHAGLKTVEIPAKNRIDAKSSFIFQSQHPLLHDR